MEYVKGLEAEVKDLREEKRLWEFVNHIETLEAELTRLREALETLSENSCVSFDKDRSYKYGYRTYKIAQAALKPKEETP